MQSNKLGEVVAFVRMGQQVYRAYNPTPYDPKTKKQLICRAKFKVVNDLAIAFSPVSAIGLASVKKQGQLNHNVFFSVNYDTVTGTTPENLTVDFPNIVIAKGKALGVAFGEPVVVDNTLTIPFTPGTGYNANGSDEVYVMAYCEDKREYALRLALRAAESVHIPIPSNFTGKVHLYGFVRSSYAGYDEATDIKIYNKGECSDSDYIGFIV